MNSRARPTDPVHAAQDDWRAMAALNLYRWLLAVGLAAVVLSGVADKLFAIREPFLFPTLCLGYLLLCIPGAVFVQLRWPPLPVQLYVLAGVDIAFVTGLLWTTSGVTEGLGLLLLAPVAGAAMLVAGRMAVMLASVASIAVLVEEVMRQLRLPGEGEFVQAGLLGAVLLITALTANTLSSRARRSAALAAQRKSALDNLAELNERIVQHMKMGLVVIDGTRRIRMLNRAARELLDLDESAVGQPLSSASPPLAWALDAWVLSPKLSAEPFDAGDRALLPEFMRLGAGAEAPVLVFLEDARRVSEQAQQMKLAALGRLTASIAHEIRNPLSAISHAGQLLDESDRLGDDEHRLLAMVQRHSSRIDTLVNNVLDLSRRARALPETIALHDWLQELVDDYCQTRPTAPDIQVRIEDDDIYVQVDPGHLRQIVQNLIQNAETHARTEDRALRVTLTAGIYPDTGEPWLDVADNGPGIPEEAIEHLMEPFYTTTNEGTGLGLYITRELCEVNLAHINLVETGPNGSRFRIHFARPEAWAEAAQHHDTPEQPISDTG